jgi:hypothetical protein
MIPFASSKMHFPGYPVSFSPPLLFFPCFPRQETHRTSAIERNSKKKRAKKKKLVVAITMSPMCRRMAVASATICRHESKGCFDSTVSRRASSSQVRLLNQQIPRSIAAVPLFSSFIRPSADSNLNFPLLLRMITSASSIFPNLADKSIVDQIAMAKEKLSAVSKNIPPELYHDIMDYLSSGHVPPSFHAVVMGQPCVAFRGNENNSNTTKHQLQTEKASAGHDEEKFTLHEIKSALPFDVGSQAFDLEGSINDDGSPQLRLRDLGNNIFEYNINATNVAVHLVNKKAIMCGHGVESTHLIGMLGIERGVGGATSWNLVTHPQSRGAIATCFNTDSTSLMIGSPGIGKSWTLLYALQQALLYDNTNVLLFACKVEHAYLFRRKGNKLYAWLSEEIAPKARSRIMARYDCLVLYDPPEGDSGGGAQYNLGNRQLIVAMSGNKRHARKGALKENVEARCFLGPPTENQLKVMIPWMQSNDTADNIMSRVPDVGPIARYILSEKYFQDRLNQRTESIDEIIANPNLLTKYLNSDGMKEGKEFYPETIFITVGTPLLQQGSDDKGDSAQLLIDDTPGNQNAGHNLFLPCSQIDDSFDYEGQHIDYKTLKIVPASRKALTQLLVGCRKTILSYLGKVRSADFIKFGDILEQIAVHDLYSSHPLEMKRTRLFHEDEKKESGKYSKMNLEVTY